MLRSFRICISTLTRAWIAAGKLPYVGTGCTGVGAVTVVPGPAVVEAAGAGAAVDGVSAAGALVVDPAGGAPVSVLLISLLSNS